MSLRKICLALVLLFPVTKTVEAQSGDDETRIIFINARGEDGRNVGYKRIVATKQEWDKLIKPSLEAQLEQEFGATKYTYSTVSPGKCFVFSRRVDEKEGALLYLDYKSSQEDAEARATELRNRKSYPRSVIEVGCHDGRSAGKIVGESTFNCRNGIDTVTVRYPAAASDVFMLSGSNGSSGNLSLVSQRRKIDSLEAELKDLSSSQGGLPASGLEGTSSPQTLKLQALSDQLKQASDEYRQKFVDGIRGSCPDTKFKDPSWVDKADVWLIKWVEESRGCSFKVPRNDMRSCEYDPMWHPEPGGIR